MSWNATRGWAESTELGERKRVEKKEGGSNRMRFPSPLLFFTCSPKLEVLFSPFVFCLLVVCHSFCASMPPAVPSPHIIVVLFLFSFLSRAAESKKSDVFMMDDLKESLLK